MKTQNKPTTEITESTRVNKAPEMNAESSRPNIWQAVLVGGVPGILFGAGGTVAVEAIANSGSTPPGGDGPELGPMPLENHAILEAHSVNDDMSFSEAFAAARDEVGPGGAFVWHGNVYGTYRGDDPEWQAMSDDDRAQHSQDILSQVHPAPYTPTTNEPPIVEVLENDTTVDSPVATNDSRDDDVDIHFVGVGQAQAEDGSVIPVGYGAVDGHYAEFADIDGDGEVDTVWIDSNDNEYPEEVEVHGASGILVDDMIAEAQANNAAAVDDALYGDMPDYTNDADTSNYV